MLLLTSESSANRAVMQPIRAPIPHRSRPARMRSAAKMSTIAPMSTKRLCASTSMTVTTAATPSAASSVRDASRRRGERRSIDTTSTSRPTCAAMVTTMVRIHMPRGPPWRGRSRKPHGP
jgi:hypothetical protein